MLDTFQPPEILGANGYWQDEDMDIDVRRNLIIGALDPRHDDVDQASCPGIGTLGSKNRNPGLPLRLLRHLVRDPENLRQVGDFVDLPAGHTVSCIDDCHYVWTGGPARRNDQADLGPFTPGGRGDGRPIWVTDLRNPTQAEGVPAADRPLAQRRADRLLARRGRRRQRHRLDERSRRAARLRDPGQVARSADGQGPERAGRGIRSSSPAAASRAGRTASPSRRPTSSTTRPARSAARSSAAGVPDGNVVLMTEEDFTGPCSQSGRIVAADITDSLGGEPATNSTPAQPYRMKALSAFHPTQDAGRHDVAERLVLRALLRGVRARRWLPPGTARGSA